MSHPSKNKFVVFDFLTFVSFRLCQFTFSRFFVFDAELSTFQSANATSLLHLTFTRHYTNSTFNVYYVLNCLNVSSVLGLADGNETKHGTERTDRQVVVKQ